MKHIKQNSMPVGTGDDSGETGESRTGRAWREAALLTVIALGLIWCGIGAIVLTQGGSWALPGFLFTLAAFGVGAGCLSHAYDTMTDR
jgi:hypothetical protein